MAAINVCSCHNSPSGGGEGSLFFLRSVYTNVTVYSCQFFPLICADLLSVPPGFKHGASFSDAKEEQGWSI